MSGIVKMAEGNHTVDPVVIERGTHQTHYVLAKGAKLHATAFVLADRTRTAKFSLTVDLTGPGAEFHLHALYMASGMGDEASRAEIEVKVNHMAPDCTSRQLIKGIATDTSTGSFKGTVHVAGDAQRTDASQRNQNIQLADSAHIFTQPQLEIYADDVRCSHGATVGRLDEEAVYYMRQRGVSEAEARRMQLHGFAGEIIEHCPSEESRESIGARIGRLVDSL